MAKKPEKQTLKDLKPQGETPPADTPTTTETDDMARKPGMAGKKEWSFKVLEDQEVPAVQRIGRTLPFPFDTMKLNAMFNVPKAFWREFSGLTDDQASNAQRNKEAIRRSFYGWRDKDPKRKSLAIAMSDQFNASKEYTGVNVYLVKAQAKAA